VANTTITALASCPQEQRLAVLVELIHSELEFRLRGGEVARVEDYLRRYPEIAAWEAVVADLLTAEFRQRRRFDPSHNGEDYHQRFPDHATLLNRLIQEAAAPESTEIRTKGTEPPAGYRPDETRAAGVSLEDYELLEVLGQGGMGEVYRSRDPSLGRDLALKVLRPELHGHPEAEARFEQEARITGSLQHPGIVPVHALGRLADGRLYFTMKVVRGRTLAEILHDSGQRGPEQQAETLAVFEKV
jgi:hypothetical protein